MKNKYYQKKSYEKKIKILKSQNSPLLWEFDFWFMFFIYDLLPNYSVFSVQYLLLIQFLYFSVTHSHGPYRSLSTAVFLWSET